MPLSDQPDLCGVPNIQTAQIPGQVRDGENVKTYRVIGQVLSALSVVLPSDYRIDENWGNAMFYDAEHETGQVLGNNSSI